MAVVCRSLQLTASRRFTYSIYSFKSYVSKEESVGNDDVSSLNARKCVAGNYGVKAKNARSMVWVLPCHNNR